MAARSAPDPAHRLPLNDGQVELDRRLVVRGDLQVTLRAKEAELLRYLAARPDRTVPRDELFDQVWGYRAGIRSRTLDTTVRRLRAAIEVDPGEPRHLLTEVGVGYRFVGVGPRDPSLAFLEAGAMRVRALLGRRSGGRVVLTGPPGVGKRRWAREIAASFAGVVVRADELAVIAAALGLDPGGDPARLRRRVEAARAKTPTLLVLEDTPLDQVAAWAPPVLTWRVSVQDPDPRLEVVRVEALPRDAALDLLRRRSGVSAGLEALVDQLGGVPLALELAAALLPFSPAAELAVALAARPERLFEAADDSVARAAVVARSRLDPAARTALDAASSFAGPVPAAVMGAAAGGVGMLARLRDLGWLVPEADGRWTVPTSLRFGADPSGRARAAEALVAALSAGVDPLVGPLTWPARDELIALVPTLRGFPWDPRVATLLAWGLAAAGSAEAGPVANALRASAPLVYARLGTDPAEARLAALDRAPASVGREALRCRLLRVLGRLDEAAAVPAPGGDEGVAAGELEFQRYLLAETRSDARAAAAGARAALRAWSAHPVLVDQARGAVAHLALVSGHLARAEREFGAQARSPGWSTAYEGEQGLGFVALLRGRADKAEAAAERASALIVRLRDPSAASAWNQVAILWRELGATERAADAVAEGLLLVDQGAGSAAAEAGLHGTLGTALLDAGRLEEAQAELQTAADAYLRLGLTERGRWVELMISAARALAGGAPVAAGSGEEGRLGYLASAFAGQAHPEGRAFAIQTLDPALAGALDAAEGRPVAEATLRCSFEARLAVALAARRDRCHTGSPRGPAADR